MSSSAQANLQIISRSAPALDIVKLSQNCIPNTTPSCVNNTIAIDGYIADFAKELGECVIVNQRIADLNEVLNTSTYITTIQKEKLDQMNGVLSDMVNQNMIAQQNYRLSDYRVNEADFYGSFLLYGIFMINIIFISAAFFVMGKLSHKQFMTIVVTMVVIYTIAVLIRIYGNHERRKTDWNKLRMGTFVAK
jgi:hypothetical protein